MSGTSIMFDLVDSIDSDTFVDKSDRNIQRVSNRLDDYIRDHNEENIHDIRTATRRLEATYRCLPKKLRTKKRVKEFVKTSKKLFRRNSEVRDCDIILEKLSEDSNLDQSLFESFEQSLLRRRRIKLDEANSKAKQLRRLSVPSLYKKDIPQKRLDKRYNKVMSEFTKRIQQRIPLVIQDSSKMRELHEMRKDCKKLRYILELLPAERDRKNTNRDDTDHVTELLETLQHIQDMAGTIHDYDTTIAYLRRQNKGTETQGSLLQQTIERISNTRQNKYEQFVEYLSTGLSHGNDNLFAGLINIRC